MAITRVQSSTGGTSGSSPANFSVTLGSAPTNGNVIILFVGLNGNARSVSTVSQTNVSWSRLDQFQDATSGYSIEVWAGVVSASAGTGITVTPDSSTFMSGVAMEYSGVATTSILDKFHHNGSASSATPFDTGSTATTTQAGELWLSGFFTSDASDGGVTQTFTSPNNSYTAVGTGRGSRFIATVGVVYNTHVDERIVSATGTAGNQITVASDGGATTWKYCATAVALKSAVQTVTVTPSVMTGSALVKAPSIVAGTGATETPSVLTGSASVLALSGTIHGTGASPSVGTVHETGSASLLALSGLITGTGVTVNMPDPDRTTSGGGGFIIPYGETVHAVTDDPGLSVGITITPAPASASGQSFDGVSIVAGGGVTVSLGSEIGDGYATAFQPTISIGQYVPVSSQSSQATTFGPVVTAGTGATETPTPCAASAQTAQPQINVGVTVPLALLGAATAAVLPPTVGMIHRPAVMSASARLLAPLIFVQGTYTYRSPEPEGYVHASTADPVVAAAAIVPMANAGGTATAASLDDVIVNTTIITVKAPLMTARASTLQPRLKMTFAAPPSSATARSFDSVTVNGHGNALVSAPVSKARAVCLGGRRFKPTVRITHVATAKAQTLPATATAACHVSVPGVCGTAQASSFDGVSVTQRLRATGSGGTAHAAVLRPTVRLGRGVLLSSVGIATATTRAPTLKTGTRVTVSPCAASAIALAPRLSTNNTMSATVSSARGLVNAILVKTGVVVAPAVSGASASVLPPVGARRGVRVAAGAPCAASAMVEAVTVSTPWNVSVQAAASAAIATLLAARARIRNYEAAFKARATVRLSARTPLVSPMRLGDRLTAPLDTSERFLEQ